MAQGRPSPIPLIIMVVVALAAIAASVIFYSEAGATRKLIDGQDLVLSSDEQDFYGDHRDKIESDGLVKLFEKYYEQARKENIAKQEVETALEEEQTKSGDLTANLNTLKDRYDRLEIAFSEARKELDSARDNADKRIADKSREISEKQTRIDALLGEIDQLNTAVQDERNKTDQMRTSLEQKLDKERSEWNLTKSTLETRVAEIEDRLIKMREIREGKSTAGDADGEILEVRANSVVINLGNREGIRKGMRFAIFRPKSDGTLRMIAHLEVKNVDNLTSLARLLDAAEFDPVMAGDLIANPAFEKGRRRVFVIAGNPVGRYNVEELGRLIEEHGGEVASEVTDATDFLIMCTNPGPALEAAKEYLVEILPEEEFLKYIEARKSFGG